MSPVDALLQAVTCLSPADWLASLESSLHQLYIGEGELDEIISRVPARIKPMIDKLDRGAQSGYETHTRLLLVEAGHRVRTQVHVPGAGALDLLVDERVGVETDGERWHGPDRFLPDRTKDLRVERYGIRVLRIARPHIFDQWSLTLAAIERMLIG
ncbi:hypothetical protein GCM10027416_25720 [Okibacterium endophyticum]